MKLTNQEVNVFGQFLINLKLKGKDSRMRTRLFKMLQERQELILSEHQQLKNEYAEKDEDGNVIYHETRMPDGSSQKGFKIAETDIKKYNSEITMLMEEEFIIEETEERKDMLLSVRNAVLNFDEDLSGDEAILHDRWCEIVEEISY